MREGPNIASHDFVAMQQFCGPRNQAVAAGDSHDGGFALDFQA